MFERASPSSIPKTLVLSRSLQIDSGSYTKIQTLQLYTYTIKTGPQMLRICFANSKGGVGKSTAAILALEWFAHRGFRVQLRDLDENRTTESWAERCAAAGREIFSEEPDLEVIETAGLLGAADAFFGQADLIVVPFRPLTADLQRTIEWYLQLSDATQEKIAFLPNMVRVPNLTRDQIAGINQVDLLLAEESLPMDRRLPGLANREAVYGVLPNGSDQNFFESTASDTKSRVNARHEATETFTAIEQILRSLIDV